MSTTSETYNPKSSLEIPISAPKLETLNKIDLYDLMVPWPHVGHHITFSSISHVPRRSVVGVQ